MKRAVVDELHKPTRRNYPRRKFDARGIDETWQVNLVEMQPYARENKESEGYWVKRFETHRRVSKPLCFQIEF